MEYEKATGGTAESTEARQSGQQYLLGRGLFRRLTTGEPADHKFLCLHHPSRWHYDILRALDYFRSASKFTGAGPEPRLAEAVNHLRSKRLADGTWPLDWTPKGQIWFEVDAGPGKPSKWLTLRAMRVLKWWEEHYP